MKSSGSEQIPAMAVLKTWAWNDRKYTTPGKDAPDLWMLLRHYADAGNRDRLYADEGEAFTAFGFDLETAGAWLLGKDARRILARGPDPGMSLRTLGAILEPEIDSDGTLQLVGQMPPGGSRASVGASDGVSRGSRGRGSAQALIGSLSHRPSHTWPAKPVFAMAKKVRRRNRVLGVYSS